jgi:hypothetical protein
MFKEIALVKGNFVDSVINYDDASGESLEDVLSRFEWDEYVILPEGKHAFYGQEKYKNYFRDVSPYPSWIYDDNLDAWVPPTGFPDGPNYLWDEEKLSWVPCDCITIE